MTNDGKFKRRASHAEQTSTLLRVKLCAVNASQCAGLGDLRNLGKVALDNFLIRPGLARQILGLRLPLFPRAIEAR